MLEQADGNDDNLSKPELESHLASLLNGCEHRYIIQTAAYNKELGDSVCAPPLQALVTQCGSAKQHTVQVWSLTHLAVSSAFFSCASAPLVKSERAEV